MGIMDFIRFHNTYKYEKRTLENIEYLHSFIGMILYVHFTYITFLSFCNTLQVLLFFGKVAQINQCYSVKMSIVFSIAKKYPCKTGLELHQQKEFVISIPGH